jgi:hypothetical protein
MNMQRTCTGGYKDQPGGRGHHRDGVRGGQEESRAAAAGARWQCGGCPGVVFVNSGSLFVGIALPVVKCT